MKIPNYNHWKIRGLYEEQTVTTENYEAYNKILDCKVYMKI